MPQPTNSEDLATFLTECGLKSDAERLAFEVARTGYRVLPASGSQSRLGGPALLPVAEVWPRADHDRPLTFLAAIDCAEVPAGTDLPTSGWLLFYADVADEGEAACLIDQADNEPGSKARCWHTYQVAEAMPPDTLRALPNGVLKPRSIRFAEQLVLPDGWEDAELLGITDEDAYEDAVQALNFGPHGYTDDGVHWLLGLATDVQGNGAAEGHRLLLQLGGDAALGLAIFDGGAIRFDIPAEDLPRANFSSVEALVSSG